MMSRDDRQGIWMIVISTAVIAFLFGLMMYIRASADNVDAKTLCRTGINDPAVIVLIDKTDPWERNGRIRLAAFIRRMKTDLAVYERLSIHVLDETGTYSPAPVFDMCNPGRGEQAFELIENRRRIQKRFEQEFAAPLDALLDDLTRPGTAPRSPIMESVVNLRHQGRHERLVIVSDMMQNSAALSFYRSADKTVPATQAIDEICRMDTPYDEISVLYINRPDIPVTIRQQVRNLWQRCFRRIAGKVSWHAL